MNNSFSNLSIILILLLCFSLIINIINYGQIQSLKNDLNIIQNNESRIEQSLNHSVTTIEKTVANMKEQESWITPVSLDVGDDSGDFRTIMLSWGIRDYTEGAAVTFYYHFGSEQDFTAVEARSTGGGGFVAELQIPKTYDPDWHVSFLGDKPDLRVERVVEEEYSANNSSLNYYISMQNGQQIMTSDKESLSIGKLAQATAPINVSVFERRKDYRITIVEQNHVEAEVTIQSAELTVYDNSKKITKVPFETIKDYPAEEEIPHTCLEAIWTTDTDDKFSPEFEIRIVYTNGREIVKKLY